MFKIINGASNTNKAKQFLRVLFYHLEKKKLLQVSFHTLT